MSKPLLKAAAIAALILSGGLMNGCRDNRTQPEGGPSSGFNKPEAEGGGPYHGAGHGTGQGGSGYGGQGTTPGKPDSAVRSPHN